MRIFPKKRVVNQKFYFINERINGPTLRVIDSQGKQIGILTKEEALDLSRKQNKDLVLIAPQANPPVAKIIEFNKFLYQENKKAKKNKSGAKGGTKDINLSLFIAENDFNRLIKRGNEFIKDGYQLRISLVLKGRELIKKEYAFELINRYINSISEVKVTKPPRLEGNVIRAVLVKSK